MIILLTESQIKILVESLDFTTLYKENYQTIYNRVCLKYAKGDTDLAKDFCQIGFTKVYENLDKFSGTGNIAGWMSRVITNEILNQFRKRKLDISDIDLTNLNIETEPSKEGFMGDRISKEQLRSAVDKLPEGYKTVLLLYYFGELNHYEIASVLNIDSGTSRSQISKAKKALEKALSKFL